ncbi:hypothetical protein DRW48_14770 [Paracoccus suum]|uniref:Uncharacterized protein n=1 Tax=Paracoccus suum TaxID=2259340 RepID=A0A344PN13_9RHOB|nr:hypothetical protein DRW48_14770 [Paracoccus suum]
MVGRVEQIGMLQKHPDGDVLGIMRLVGRVGVAGLDIREQIDAPTAVCAWMISRPRASPSSAMRCRSPRSSSG